MRVNFQHGIHTVFPRIFSDRLVLVCIIGFMFVTALGIRVYHISEPPFDFHSTRQYRSAIISRGYYFEAVKSIPEWRRQVASINKEREGILEPPVMELISSIIYRVIGGEYLWIPRLLSSIFWLVGGIFVYLIAYKLYSTGPVLLSTAFYLYLPFSVVASRSFQPDPMMVMMALISIYTIIQYYERPSMARFGIAIAFSSLAIFIKPVCIFLIFGVYISLAIFWRSITSRNFLIFIILSLFPTGIFYFYGIFISGFLKKQAQLSFLPHLLVSSFYWKGWIAQIKGVIGYTAFIGSLLGLLRASSIKGLPRVLLIGLWSGYFVFGLVFIVTAINNLT